MAESPSGGSNSSPPNQPKELSMEKRLLLAFILMGAVLFTTPYFFQTNKPPAKKTETVPPKSGQGAPPSESKEVLTVTPATGGTPGAPATSAQKEELFTIDTNVYRVTF